MSCCLAGFSSLKTKYDWLVEVEELLVTLTALLSFLDTKCVVIRNIKEKEGGTRPAHLQC
jgi:hypothetical protein